MSKLILIRHGESTYNAKDLWCGWDDPSLSEKGIVEAKKAGETLKDLKIDVVFVSDLIRSVETWQEVAKVLKLENLPTIVAPEIKERDYGDFTKVNKLEVKEKYGEEQWHKWRRGWDEPIPNGETLKDVYNRAVPFYITNVVPLLKNDKNVFLSAHGNSARALVKYLDNLSDKEVENLEIPTGTLYIYDVDNEGKIIGKEIRTEKELEKEK